MQYEVRPWVRGAAAHDAWDAVPWDHADELELRHFMGDPPAHFPCVQARLLYEPGALLVRFRVQDRFVRAVATAHQQAVYRDSCVEFFFSPAPHASIGYFNLEMNCGGTLLMHFQKVPRKGREIDPQHVARIQVRHSLPAVVELEIQEPVCWTVEYRLPLDLLWPYCPEAVRPAPGAIWRANFYKCADASSHPHWLTWAPVDHPRPDFHRPESFGKLLFV